MKKIDTILGEYLQYKIQQSNGVRERNNWKELARLLKTRQSEQNSIA